VSLSSVKGSSKCTGGVDTDLGNKCSKIAFGWAQKTFCNRKGRTGLPVISGGGSFCNIMSFGALRIGMTSDGIGTKVELAERTGNYSSLGFDLVAMVADDLAANGVEPVNLSNILDVDFLDSEIVDELMKGLCEAAEFSGMAVTGGEIAELGKRIDGYGKRMHFNWCATALGILPEDREPITGNEVVAGDSVIALKSRGFRSNGFSAIRNIMREKFGDDWHNRIFKDKRSWGEVLQTPALIYSPLIMEIIRAGIPVHGIAHITGGGIPDNLGRILKVNKLGADLENIFSPLDFMLEIQSLGGVEEIAAYKMWNMGNGMLVIVPSEKVEQTLDIIAKTDYLAQKAGKIIDRPEILINSKGASPRLLSYEKTGK